MIQPILLLLLLSIIPLSTAFGYEYYGTDADYILKNEPLICITESSIKDFSRYKSLIKQSIDNWQNNLREYTENYEAWNISHKFLLENYESDESFNLDSANCDIFIDLIDNVENNAPALTWKLESKQTLIEISTIMKLSDSLLLSIITHELGHTFGLEHYIPNEIPSKVKPLSIMMDGKSFTASSDITELDLMKMVSIYGNDGFDNSNPNLPSWIITIFKWNNEELIEDLELNTAIDYLIQNKIIQIT